MFGDDRPVKLIRSSAAGSFAVNVDAIRALWESGETDRAARAIDDAIPERMRPGWAAETLEVICSRLTAVPEEVRAVVSIGRTPGRFRDAHAAFSAVRALILAEDRSGAGGSAYAAVLSMAEDAAKVIYNASGVQEPIQPGETAPFDDGCGYLLARGVVHLAQTCGSSDFDRAAWAVQESWLRRAARPWWRLW
jgi:hypothetical protein